MRTEDFVKTLRRMTKATASAAPHAVAVPRVDFETFETIAAAPAETAAAIIAAGAKARNGCDTAPKLSATAQAILDAGKKRRAGG
jgi:hypothetical protein